MKLGNYCILCIDQKNLQNISIKFDRHYSKMETVFRNTENSKKNEPHRLKIDSTINLISQIQIKIWL